MLRLWKWYQNSLATHPVKTQMISSALIWGFGDIAAQTITHTTFIRQRRIQANSVFYTTSLSCLFNRVTDLSFMLRDEKEEFKINWKRVATTSLFGFELVGPVGHFWYEGLDRFMRLRLRLQPNSFWFVANKVALEGFIFGPFDLLVFFTYMGFSAGKSVPQIKEDVKRDFIPALILEGGVWPVVQIVNFLYVPVRYQLLYVNFFCSLDSCFLSWLEQQEDAPWKHWVKPIFHLKEEKESQDR